MSGTKKIPDWVLVQRKKGTEIHRRGDNFYLCKVSSVWDKKLKRARKITGEYLGKITKDGIVPPKQKQLLAAFKQVTVKEYGASSYLRFLCRVSGEGGFCTRFKNEFFVKMQFLDNIIYGKIEQ
ncbi:hypothetical protein C5S35_12175 [Candidatus Methanophagaceae archaeon]|nr:hypothetical protein C5S35_12175 [Methanophagales archaeon]